MAGSQDDFEDRGPGVFATCIATLAVSTAFFSMRMASRLFVVKKITNDDIVMACGWLVSVFLTMTVCLAATHGLGRRDRDIDPGDFPNLRRSEYSFSVLYNAALGLVKSSILVFYIRIAGKTQVVLRYMSMATLVVVVLTAIATTLVSIFQCSPVDASWDLSITTFTCIPLLSAFICASPVNIITNLIILVGPFSYMAYSCLIHLGRPNPRLIADATSDTTKGHPRRNLWLGSLHNDSRCHQNLLSTDSHLQDPGGLVHEPSTNLRRPGRFPLHGSILTYVVCGRG